LIIEKIVYEIRRTIVSDMQRADQRECAGFWFDPLPKR
jgi:hypothetical protein